MAVKGRTGGALVLCLLWAMTAWAVYYLISETIGQSFFWLFVLISLFLLAVGVATFLGYVKALFILSPFSIMLFMDLSKYDLEKASFVLGIMAAAFSYSIFLMPLGAHWWFFVVAVTAFVIGVFYVFASKRFKTAAPQKR